VRKTSFCNAALPVAKAFPGKELEDFSRFQGFHDSNRNPLPEEEIACFVNWAVLDRTRKLPQAAGATLVDGISVISGTTDPRLIAILSKIDAAMRERIDRIRAEPQDPHREVLDRFFEP
jgi:hypothetical protein